MTRRERLRQAITAWHETRGGECLANSEGQSCCVDPTGAERAPYGSYYAYNGGLDGLLDAIEAELESA